MAFTLAALGASSPCTILGAKIVDVSYPHFFETLETVRS
jgi:5-enolpyruvylshikimate-3-phosphate synthase